jgi:hypothetical protein
LYAERSWLAVEHFREQYFASFRFASKDTPHMRQTQIGRGFAAEILFSRRSASLHQRQQNSARVGFGTTNRTPQ